MTVIADKATKFTQEIKNHYGVMNTIITDNTLWTITLVSTRVLTNVVSHTFLDSLLQYAYPRWSF
jgi:hypothetical protein